MIEKMTLKILIQLSHFITMLFGIALGMTLTILYQYGAEGLEGEFKKHCEAAWLINATKFINLAMHNTLYSNIWTPYEFAFNRLL